MAQVLQSMGRSEQHISCTTIGKMKEHKRRGIYKQKMDIPWFCMNKRKLRWDVYSSVDALQKNIG